MLDRQGDILAFECDGCGEVEESDDEFNTAWAELKREGWVAYKVGSDWEHKCPRCARGANAARDNFEKPDA